MRRSFKVATVFTGAAALAGGFGPAALAATAQPGVIHPDYTAKECLANNGGVSHWVHLYYPNDDHPAECLGGTTTYQPVDATVASFCPGNNYGFFSGSVNGTYYQSIGFSAGGPRARILGFPEFHISAITILGDTGDATCG